MQRGIPEASIAFRDGVGGISGGGGEGVEDALEVARLDERGVALSVIPECRGERRRMGFGVSSGSDLAWVGKRGEGEGEAVVT